MSCGGLDPTFWILVGGAASFVVSLACVLVYNVILVYSTGGGGKR